MPQVAEKVWRAFWQIERRSRFGNGYSALPVLSSEIESWCRLRGEHFEPWELDLLDRLEGARLAYLNGEKPEPVKDPLTPQSFLAMFERK